MKTLKRLIWLALCTVAVTAHGTTLNPVQLLNPTGSTSGQAIISTGSSSAPAWGNVSGASLAAQAANTVLANVTASSASPTAFAMPSCSTSASALIYTTSTGFTCNTAVNAATLGGATFAAPGSIGSTTAAAGKFTTLQATSTITPSSTAGIVGTATNDSANAGSIGEYVPNTSGAISLTSATPANTASISLTAGDWDVWGSVAFAATGGTVPSSWTAGINTTSATLPASTLYAQIAATMAANSFATLAVPMQRILLSGTTTVYMVAQANYSSGTTGTGTGFIAARRRR